MKYLVSQIDTWRKELAALPPPDPGRRRVGKQQAVILLAKELQAAARQGYTAGELLEVLAAKGLTVHGDTLRDGLRKGRRNVAAAPTRGRRRSGDGNGDRPEATARLGGKRGDVVSGISGEQVGNGDEPVAVSGPPSAVGPRAIAAESGRNEAPTGQRRTAGRPSQGGPVISPARDAPGLVRPAAGSGGRAALAPGPPPGRVGKQSGEDRGEDAVTEVGAAPAKSESSDGKVAGATRPPPAGPGTFTPRVDSVEI